LTEAAVYCSLSAQKLAKKSVVEVRLNHAKADCYNCLKKLVFGQLFAVFFVFLTGRFLLENSLPVDE
jgi:hypothetical protein